jgi:hypothetical protein
MPQCNYPTAGFSNVHECQNQGWEQLDGLCMGHYREYVVAPMTERLAATERLYMELSNKLFKVEVASGLRAAPTSTREYHHQDGSRSAKPPVNSNLRAKQQPPANDEVEDFI